MEHRLSFPRFWALVRREISLVIWPAMIGLAVGVSSAQNPRIVAFSVPGSGTGANQGTFAYSINSQAAITGFYLDAKNVYHGFLRSPEGAFTTFEAPGAGDVAGSHQGTYALSINAESEIAGFYRDTNYLHHGYLRNSNGTFTIFDAPGMGTRPYQGTFAYSVSSSGAIAGFYLDEYDLYHGFLRSPDGVFTTFDAPGAGDALYSDQGTLSGLFCDLDSSGEIAGFYLDANYVYHGFLRSSNGAFTTFEASGANTTPGSYHGTVPGCINDSGLTTGYYIDAAGTNHGFVRNPDGAFMTFEAPGGGTRSGQGTVPSTINELGAITGYSINVRGVYNGFVRNPDGSFTTFNVAGAGTSAGQGTLPQGNNAPAGEVTGYYTDPKGVNHGFLRIP